MANTRIDASHDGRKAEIIRPIAFMDKEQLRSEMLKLVSGIDLNARVARHLISMQQLKEASQ